MRKRLLSLALVLVMTLTLLPTAALAADSDFTIKNGILEGYHGPGGDVVIPDSVTFINEFAFSGRSNLTSVTIPNSVDRIGRFAFQNCTSLTSVTIPDSVTLIADCAFSGCTSLTSVTIPSSVTYIGQAAFSRCSSLTSITIPSSVTYMGKDVFSRCGSLTSITVAEGNQFYASQDGMLFNDNMTELIRCPDGKTGACTIPASVSVIAQNAFSDHTSLTDIYYGGTETQWKGLTANVDSKLLKTVTVHYNSSVPSGKASAFTSITGGKAIPFKYDDAENFCEGFAAVELEGKWGFIDATGKQVVPCEYDRVQKFSDGLAAVCIGDYLNAKWGFVDATGRETIPCKYDRVESFSGGLAAVNIGGKVDGMNFKGGKWGFIDKNGNEVIPCKYDKVEEFCGNLALVNVGGVVLAAFGGGKWGFVDPAGKEVVPCKYDMAKDFSEGLARVNIGGKFDGIFGLGGKWGFIDATGKEIIPCKYDDASDFSNGLAAVERNGKWGFIDTAGKEVVPCKYDGAKKFSNGLATVTLDRKRGFIDTAGREIVPCKYDDANDFFDGLAAVKLNGKWGFVDAEGKEVVPCKYDVAMDCSQGLVAVREGFKYGFIDKTGKQTVPCTYDEVEDFHGGFAKVKMGKAWGLVHTTGEKAVSCTYSDAKDVSEGFAAVELQGAWGFLAIDGNTVYLPLFDALDHSFKSVGNDPALDPSGNTSTPTTPPTHKPVGEPKTFPDVAPDAWYAEAVNAMAANGVIKGGTDGLFHPDAPITYGELVTILARVSGVQDVIDRRAIEKPDEEYLVEGQGGYGRRVIDVSYNHTNHWAANAWAWLNEFLNTPVPVVVENLDCKADRAGALDLVYATKYWMVNGNSNRNHPGTRHHTYEGTLDYVHNYGYSDIPGMQELMNKAIEYAPEQADYAKSNQIGAVVLDEKLNLWPDEYIQHFDKDGNLAPGYDMDMVAEYTAPFYKPISMINLGNILGAYNTGITTGVDANRTGNFTATITRAEVAVMLYRAGLDDVYELCCSDYPCPLAAWN